MSAQELNSKYELWLEKATLDEDLTQELKAMDEAKIEDAFYRDLAFGTGGLRGVIGAGTNRMNIYTVAKASQGLADYVNSKEGDHSIAVSNRTCSAARHPPSSRQTASGFTSIKNSCRHRTCLMPYAH